MKERKQWTREEEAGRAACHEGYVEVELVELPLQAVEEIMQ